MVGDLFHSGHVELLKGARQFGDWLVVGVLSDETAKSYKRLPIMTLEERVSVVRACRYVDEVIPAAPDVVTTEFLDEHDIALVVHGNDLGDEAIDGVYREVRMAGKLQLIERTSSICTTELLRRIQSRNSQGSGA